MESHRFESSSAPKLPPHFEKSGYAPADPGGGAHIER